MSNPNPDFDLVLERTVPVSPEKVWAAWTQPELMVQWFTPAPWKTVSCDVDLRPGGRFYITMESPEGEQFPNNHGCILQVIPNRRTRSRCGAEVYAVWRVAAVLGMGAGVTGFARARWISPTYRWLVGSSILRRSWTGRPGGCSPGACRSA